MIERLPGRSRHYRRTDTGRTVPSVTTIVGLTPKPYLLNWVVKLAAEWSADNLDVLGAMPYEERVQTIKDQTRELREEGARAGTALHEFAELYLWLGTYEPPLNHAQQGVVDILERLQPEVLYTEATVWNGAIGYAGTLDGIWQVRDETWLVDWKTSKSRSAEWALQLEAYRRAETILTTAGDEVPMPHIDRMVILWTPYNPLHEAQVLPVDATDSEWYAFLAAARVLHWHETRGVLDVFGDPLP